MTPAQQAREIAERILCSVIDGWPSHVLDSAADLIAAALTTLRTNTLEEAAKIADAEQAHNLISRDRAQAAGREGVASHRETDASTAGEIATAIRARKGERN